MKNLYKIQDELYIIDNNEKVTQNGIWAKCSFTGDILKNRNGQYAHKVILTTNKLLIKDGVQSIDDEFLEWFVKNPSCEEVEIGEGVRYEDEWIDNEDGGEIFQHQYCSYKIIIPKEESKQTVQEYEQQGLEKYSYELEPKQDFYKIGDFDKNCDDDCKYHCTKGNTQLAECLKEPKQETLEEYLQVCKDCGSKEVARCKWVNVNTEEIYSADSGITLEWCFNCKTETNIIDKEDYEK